MGRFVRAAALVLAFALFAPTGGATAESWRIVEDRSLLRYVSVKNGDTAEINRIPGVDGTFAEGVANLTVDLLSVDTGVEIRDERLKEHVLGSGAQARIFGRLDMLTLKTLPVGEIAAIEMALAVAANGESVSYDAALLVARLSETRVLVTTSEPLILHLDDFGYGEGVEKLRELAGLDSIQPIAPITAELVFERVEDP